MTHHLDETSGLRTSLRPIHFLKVSVRLLFRVPSWESVKFGYRAVNLLATCARPPSKITVRTVK